MRLSEIWDPSDYRKGDELDPRSPYYDEPDEDEGETYPTKFKWEFYDEEGNDTPVTIIGTVTIAFANDVSQHEDDWVPPTQGVTCVTIQQVQINGQTITGIQAAELYGEHQFNQATFELADLAASGITTPRPPKITNKNMDVEIEYQ